MRHTPVAVVTFPVYLTIGPVSAHPHWVFDVLAYTTGIWLLRRRARREHDVVGSRARWVIVVAGIVGGVVGSHLLYMLEDLAPLGSGAYDADVFLQGKTIVGGLIGGLVAVELVKARRGITVATGDLFVVPLAAGMAIGRIGCFLTGLADGTSGTATRLPWGVDFGDGILRHPTQLYEIAFLMMLLLFIMRMAPRLQLDGDAFKIFFLGYMSFRVVVDFIKPATRVAGISVLQWACLAVIVYYSPHLPRLLATVRRS
jgi:phosphatidylglycerol---prolipoprotein diacylglyceryl transferase